MIKFKQVYYLLLLLFYSNSILSQNLESIGDELFKLVNSARIEHSLTSATYNEKLCKAAKIQSDYLLTIKKLDDITHVHPNPKLARCWDRVASLSNDKNLVIYENITVFTYNSNDNIALRAHNNFMNSKKGHRQAVLLNNVGCLGDVYSIKYGQSIVYEPKHNWIIIVQLYALHFEDD
jgi:uncharacterized protein YkwD